MLITRKTNKQKKQKAWKCCHGTVILEDYSEKTNLLYLSHSEDKVENEEGVVFMWNKDTQTNQLNTLKHSLCKVLFVDNDKEYLDA